MITKNKKLLVLFLTCLLSQPAFSKEMHNYYEILGVSQDASQKEIRAAGKKMLSESHPDKFKDPNQKAEATKRFFLIKEARQVLEDPKKRAPYDTDWESFLVANKKKPGLTNTSTQKKKAQTKDRVSFAYFVQAILTKMQADLVSHAEKLNLALSYRVDKKVLYKKAREKDAEALKEVYRLLHGQDKQAINFILELVEKGNGKASLELKKLLETKHNNQIIEAILTRESLRSLQPFLLEKNLVPTSHYENFSSKDVVELLPSLIQQSLQGDKRGLNIIKKYLEKNDTNLFPRLIQQKDNFLIRNMLLEGMNDFRWQAIASMAQTGDVPSTEFLLELSSVKDYEQKVYQIFKNLMESHPKSLPIIYQKSMQGNQAAVNIISKVMQEGLKEKGHLINFLTQQQKQGDRAAEALLQGLTGKSQQAEKSTPQNAKETFSDKMKRVCERVFRN